MLTFFLFIIPILGTIFCSFFYVKFVDKNATTSYIPRLVRWVLNIMCFIPIIGWVTFCVWVYIFSSKETKFLENKITDFFIKN